MRNKIIAMLLIMPLFGVISCTEKEGPDEPNGSKWPIYEGDRIITSVKQDFDSFSATTNFEYNDDYTISKMVIDNSFDKRTTYTFRYSDNNLNIDVEAPDDFKMDLTSKLNSNGLILEDLVTLNGPIINLYEYTYVKGNLVKINETATSSGSETCYTYNYKWTGSLLSKCSSFSDDDKQNVKLHIMEYGSVENKANLDVNMFLNPLNSGLCALYMSYMKRGGTYSSNLITKIADSNSGSSNVKEVMFEYVIDADGYPIEMRTVGSIIGDAVYTITYKKIE